MAEGSVMPKGVEHLAWDMRVGRQRTEGSVMPEGVEHFKIVALVTFLLARKDR